MLGFLRGTVRGRLDQRILIEVQDTGYWVYTGSWQPSGEVECYLHHHVREDQSDLFGFKGLGELELFEKLLAISGIGPKAALALLSIGTPERIREAIAVKDTAFLSSAPGIGQKAAQKIILELSGKLDTLGFLGEDTTPHSDLIAALTGLGYKQSEIVTLLRTLPAEIESLDAQMKWILKQLA